MRNMMIFIIFCCAVGCGTVLSFCYFWGDLLEETVVSTEKEAEEAVPVQQPAEKRQGKQVIDGETYYYDANGKKLTDLQRIDDYYYYFAADGRMLKNRKDTVLFDGIPIPCYMNDDGQLGFMATVSQELLPAVEQEEAVQPTFERTTAFNINEVQREIEAIMARYGGKTSVYFQDLETNQQISLNNSPMYPCCMIKTAALSAFMHRVEEGSIDYQRYQPYIGPMIIHSDNTSYNRLMKGLGDGDALLGASRLNEYCDAIGMGETAAYHGLKPGEEYFTTGHSSNVSSANDIGRYFEKLYYGQLADVRHTQDMLNLYVQCIDREGIASGLPTNVAYAHKTGEAYDFYHDGGIVYAEGRPYIVVAFTDGVTNNRAFMKDLSSYLYHYQMTTIL